MGAVLFCHDWLSLAVLYWIVSRFLARLFFMEVSPIQPEDSHMYAVAQGTCLFMGIGREPCQYDCEFFTMVMVQEENPLRPLLFQVRLVVPWWGPDRSICSDGEINLSRYTGVVSHGSVALELLFTCGNETGYKQWPNKPYSRLGKGINFSSCSVRNSYGQKHG